MANIKVSELPTASNFNDEDYTMIVQSGENKKILGGNLGKITASGSNANGNYIKFSDGTMICYGRQQINFAMNIAYGNVYRGDTQTINLPMAFVDTNYRKIVMPLAPANSVYNVDNNITTSSFEFIPIAYTSREADNQSVEYFAIGKWK